MKLDDSVHGATRAQVKLRPADLVMQPKRLGAFHASRLSFVRCLVRRMVRERWRIT